MSPSVFSIFSHDIKILFDLLFLPQKLVSLSFYQNALSTNVSRKFTKADHQHIAETALRNTAEQTLAQIQRRTDRRHHSTRLPVPPAGVTLQSLPYDRVSGRRLSRHYKVSPAMQMSPPYDKVSPSMTDSP